MYRIGELAKLADVTPDTIRYYEKQQMMAHDVRTEGGFRLYTENDLQRLRFIRYARQLGFTLEAIRELLSIRVDPEHHTCQESKGIVQARLSEVDARIKELQTMRRSLQRLNEACCGTAHSSVYCSMLEPREQGASSTTAERGFFHRADLHSRRSHSHPGAIMSRYQHTKGQIKDNAIEALLHDPLFRQRVEKNRKGKGSYQRKDKHAGRNDREASGKRVNRFFTTGLLLSVA